MDAKQPKNSEYQLTEKVEGMIKVEHFKHVEVELPKAKEGEIVVKARHISVDPYVRGRIKTMNAGDVPVVRSAALCRS